MNSTAQFRGIWNTIEQRNLMGRMATPQDIAQAAVFLASLVLSFTSGINLVVDEAFTVRVNF